MDARILLVEDDPSIREVTAIGLRNAGFTVETADDGRAGIERFEAADFDLVLLDVMLPKIDGFALLKQLRAAKRTARVPVMIVSSFDRDKDVARGMELGANDYVIKPLMEYQFLGCVARFAPQKDE